MDKIGSGIMTNAGHYIIIIQHYDSILSNYLLTSSQWIVLPQQRWMSRTKTINIGSKSSKLGIWCHKKINRKKEFTSRAACDYECSTLFKSLKPLTTFYIVKIWLLATKIQPGENESYKCSKYQLQHFELSKCLNHSNSHTEEERETNWWKVNPRY